MPLVKQKVTSQRAYGRAGGLRMPPASAIAGGPALSKLGREESLKAAKRGGMGRQQQFFATRSGGDQCCPVRQVTP